VAKGKEAFVNALAQTPGVVSASWTTSIPPRIWDGDSFPGEGKARKTIPINFAKADENYFCLR